MAEDEGWVQAWEYEIYRPSSDTKIEAVKEQLNELGLEGWELVSGTDTFVFKRPIVEESEEDEEPENEE